MNGPHHRAFAAWTIYDHPLDYPSGYIARKFLLDQGSEPVPTAEVMTSPDLDTIREELESRGLTRFLRAPGDPLSVVETWL